MRKLLVIVDPLNGFLDEGPLSAKPLRDKVPYIVNLLTEFDRVAILRDAHSDNSSEFKHMPSHCVSGTEESEIVPELITGLEESNFVQGDILNTVDPDNFYEIMNKDAYTGRIEAKGLIGEFGVMLNVVETLPEGNHFNEVHVTGFVTSICVYNAIQDLFYCEGVHKIVLHTQGIGDIPEELGGLPEAALFNHLEKVYNVEIRR